MCINTRDCECTRWKYLIEYSDIASDILAIQMLHFCKVTSEVTLLVSMWHISLLGVYPVLERFLPAVVLQTHRNHKSVISDRNGH